MYCVEHKWQTATTTTTMAYEWMNIDYNVYNFKQFKKFVVVVAIPLLFHIIIRQVYVHLLLLFLSVLIAISYRVVSLKSSHLTALSLSFQNIIKI